MADRASVRSVLEQMVADGASHEQIMEFVERTKAEGSQANEARDQRLQAADKQYAADTSAGGVIKGAASDIWDKAKALGRGVKTLGRMAVGATNPAGVADDNEMLTTLVDPARRRQFGRGLSDSMFGLPAKIADSVGEPSYRENEAADAAAAPDHRTAGALAGSALPGSGVNVVGRGSLALATKLGLSPAAAALASTAVTSGVAAGAHADAGSGKDRLHAALQAATDPFNYTIPLAVKGAQKVGQAGRSLTASMRDDTSALGGGADTLKTLDEMRDRGAVKGNLRREVRDPELARLPRGKKGYVKAAQNARDEIGGNTSADLKAARAQYDQDITDVLGAHADDAYMADGLKQRIAALREENTANGVTGDEKLATAIDKVERMAGLKAKKPEASGLVDEMGNPVGGSEPTGATVGDFIKAKKLVNKLAERGMPATDENRPYRLLARELAQEAEAIDPRLKDINAKYKATMDRLEETNDILYGQDAPQVADRPAARRRAAGKLMRTGDDTTSGELGEEDVTRLGELDPRNEKPIRTLREKKAIERTRFGMPNMSKSPEKWGVGLLEQNTEAMRARVVDPIARALAAAGIDPFTSAIIRARLAAQQQGETP